MKLTDLGIRALPFEAGQRDYADDALSGLTLRVGRKTKTFFLIRRKGQRRERVKLGIYPDLKLADAREKARDILAEARVAKAEEPIALTWTEALGRFKELHIPTMRPNSQRQCKRLLDTYFTPRFAKRPLPDIKTSELAAVIDAIPTRSEKRNGFVWVRTFLNWSWRRGHIDVNPIARLRGYGAATSRDRVLSDNELVLIWRALDRHFSPSFATITKLLILTGQRKGQWLAYRPDFIKGDTISWSADFMKMKRPHIIPVTETTADILKPFHNSGFGTWPISSYNKQALDQLSGVTGWTIHDLRRTFATKLAELGTAPHIIERILAHQTGTISGVAAIYNRAAYLPEMKFALLAFEERLQALLLGT